jgi:hypothetical protein
VIGWLPVANSDFSASVDGGRLHCVVMSSEEGSNECVDGPRCDGGWIAVSKGRGGGLRVVDGKQSMIH